MTAPVPEDKLRLGGMALRNGLLVHGPTHWAAAVRTEGGDIKMASGRKPDLGARAAERLPGVRGVAKYAHDHGLSGAKPLHLIQRFFRALWPGPPRTPLRPRPWTPRARTRGTCGTGRTG
jgi:hypothetical protein